MKINSSLNQADGSSCTSERAIFIQSLQQRRKGKLNDFLTDQLTGSSGSERSVDVQRSTNGQMELVFLVDAIEINRRWCLKYPTETARRDSKYFVKQILKNARFDETTPLGATTRTFSIPCQVPAAGHLQRKCRVNTIACLELSVEDVILY